MHAVVPADVQQGPVPAGLRQHLLQPGGDDAGGQRGNRRRHVRGQDRCRSSGRCGASGTGSLRPAVSRSRRRTGSCARWACRRGRTSWSARWCACCWRRITSRGSLAGRTGSGKGEGVIPRCGKYKAPGPGPRGLLRVTSPTASESLDHDILIGILAEKIHDQRFLRLIRNMLKAGYLEDWQYHETLSGCPQGGVVSPILSNIYLDKLDEFAERELIPQYTRGARRAREPRLQASRTPAEARAAARGPGRSPRSGRADAHAPLDDPMDPGYRRLRYIQVRR